MENEKKVEIKSLIENGKIKQALEEFSNEKSSIPVQLKISLLKSRFSRTQNDYHDKGIIPRDTYSLEIAKITNSLLQLINNETTIRYSFRLFLLIVFFTLLTFLLVKLDFCNKVNAIESFEEINNKLLQEKSILQATPIVSKISNINIQDSSKQNLLMSLICTRDNPKNWIDLFIDKKIDLFHTDTFGTNLLHRVCTCKKGNLVGFLLNKGFQKLINSTTNDGYTPLMLAASVNDSSAISILLQNNALKDNYRNQLLIGSIKEGNFQKVKECYEDKADLNTFSRTGLTALMLAVIQKKAKIVEFLVKNGANLNLKSKQQKTALDYALENNSEIIIHILKNTSDTIKVQLNTTQTPPLVISTAPPISKTKLVVRFENPEQIIPLLDSLPSIFNHQVFCKALRHQLILSHNQEGNSSIRIKRISIEAKLVDVPNNERPNLSYTIDILRMQGFGIVSLDEYSFYLKGSNISAQYIKTREEAFPVDPKNIFRSMQGTNAFTINSTGEDSFYQLSMIVNAMEPGLYKFRYQINYELAGQSKEKTTSWIYIML